MSKGLSSRLAALEQGARPGRRQGGLFIVSVETLLDGSARRALMQEHNLLSAVFLPQKEVSDEIGCEFG